MRVAHTHTRSLTSKAFLAVPNLRPEKSMSSPKRIILGVVTGQSRSLLEHAAVFAQQFDADLVCAHVDTTRYVEEVKPDGTIVSLPFDPDLVDLREENPDPKLLVQLHEVLDPAGVRWTSRALAGDAAHALTALADEVDAEFIIVGTRKPGVRRSVHEFFDGSVGARLAHLQHRPVVIVPLSPVREEKDLPWATG